MIVRRFLVASALLAVLPLFTLSTRADGPQVIPGFTVGNATYSDITVLRDPVNASAITDPSGNSVITFTHQNSPTWTGNTGSTISYTVTFANPVQAIGISFDGTATGGSFLSALASVGETIAFTGPIDTAHPTGLYEETLSDLAAPVTGIYAAGDGSALRSLNYIFPAPVSSITVEPKSIDTAENGGIATIGSVQNIFIPSGGIPGPEPASLGILAVGGAALLSRRRTR
ncbi:MAG: PEP-CTERM sorting domain-containing protein [Phycisphaerae bacterium]